MSKTSSPAKIGVVFFGGLKVKGRHNHRLIGRIRKALADETEVSVICDVSAKPDAEAKIKAFCQNRFGQELPITKEIAAGMRLVTATPADKKAVEARKASEPKKS